MRNLGLWLILLLLFSCSKEVITPAFEVETLSSQNQGKPYEFQYPLEPFSVDGFANDINDNNVPVIGDFLRGVVGSVADLTLQEEDGQLVPIDPIVYEIPELNDYDFDFIFQKVPSIWIEGVNLHIKSPDLDEYESLAFIKEIKVYIKSSDKLLGHTNLLENEKDNGDLLLYFNRDEHSYECLTRCLPLKVNNLNWKRVVKNKRRFILKTELVVDGVPRENIKIGGNVVIKGHINPGF